jgi:hypothetical protein
MLIVILSGNGSPSFSEASEPDTSPPSSITIGCLVAASTGAV